MADAVHPVARILFWCGWAVAVEIAVPSRLAFLAVAVATAFLFPAIRTHMRRLLRRTRWLLIVLFLAYAWSLPGVPLVPAADWASPTLEGVEAGALRAARLALMLAGLAVLLAATAQSRLLYGIYAVAKPFVLLGLDRRALVVRLGLTLDYLERAPQPAHWRDALSGAEDAPEAPVAFVLETERWQTRDSAVILAAVLLLGFAWA